MPSFVAVVLALVMGVISASFWPAQLSSLWPQFSAVFASIGLLAALLKRQWRLLSYVFAFAAGASLFACSAIKQQQQMLAPSCDGQTFSTALTIKSLPVAKGKQWQFAATLAGADLASCFDGSLPRVKLSWWQNNEEAYRPQQGDLITATVKLRRPHSTQNPGGFDYVAWLWRQQLYATGYIKSVDSIDARGQVSVRAGLERKINTILVDHPARPLVLALSLGQRGDVSAETWQAARETGLSHLLAISGLHLGLIAAAMLLLATLIAKQFPREKGWGIALLMLPAMLVVSFYAYMAGWPLSTQRAWVMLLVFWLAASFNWRLPRFHAWAFALLLCLLLQPLNVLDGGFYLSFGAVALLLWFTSAMPKNNKQWVGAQKLWSALRLQFVLLLGLLPLQLSFFAGFSLLALPLNLLLIPPFALLILPALLVMCAGLMLNIGMAEQGLILVADALQGFEATLFAIQTFANDRWFAWQLLGQPSWPLWCLLCLSILLIALPKGFGLRLLAVPLLAISIGLNLLGNRAQLPAGAFVVHSFDAGQGTAVLIQTQHANILYDTAAGWRSGGSAMQTMVLPALANLGVQQVDLVIISHDDNDHIGGLDALLSQYPQTPVIGTNAKPCTIDFVLEVDGVKLQALAPVVGPNNHNDQSCLIKISSRFGNALLTGDIGVRAEKKLLAAGAPIQADWLLVPHHGSRSSSSEAFISAVRPNTAVITSGHNNRYRLPAAEVMQRYLNLMPGIRLLNTAEDGAISSKFSVNCRPCTDLQNETKRWWQHQID